MAPESHDPFWNLLGVLFQAHPWHGVSIGENPPDVVTSYIEITPADTVKYELDKISGKLMVDRPQVFSNVCPTLYGLIPQTYCGESVAALCMERTGRESIVGDHDPLDICVLTEPTVTQRDILLQARPIGGLRMIDSNEADDKIIAVMNGDAAYGDWESIEDCPSSFIEKLRHYFLTYKQPPGSEKTACEITHVYGRDEAHDVIRRSREDYELRFGGTAAILSAAFDRV